MNRITAFCDTLPFGRLGMDARPLADRAVSMVVPVMMVMGRVTAIVVTMRDKNRTRVATKFALDAGLGGVFDDRVNKGQAHGSHIAAQREKVLDPPCH